MKNKHRIVILLAVFTALILLGWARSVGAQMTANNNVVHVKPVPQLTHAQQVWLGALEWCESRGDALAINKKDRDGTPSYGAFQFKPGTLTSYGKQYGIEATSTMDYQTQKNVVTAMVLDQRNINWHQQFPDCVKRLGKPPANATI